MSTMNQPEVAVTITANASTEVKKFMEQEGVDPAKGGLRVSVQPVGRARRSDARLCCAAREAAAGAGYRA